MAFMSSFCPRPIIFLIFVTLRLFPTMSYFYYDSHSCMGASSKDLSLVTKLLHFDNRLTTEYLCHHQTHRVIALAIYVPSFSPSVSPSSPLPPIEFGELVELVCHLHFLTNLTIYHLPSRGSIPLCLGHLKNLSHLDLSYNSLTGAIPESLHRISYLDMSHNSLTGAIPKSLHRISHLDLSYNSLTGVIPESLHIISHLDLSFNSLTGAIPRSLHIISHLDLSSNYLTGTIPESLQIISHLDLSFNSLTGVIPKSLHKMNSLIFVDLLENTQLTGSISSVFPSSLQYLDVRNTGVVCDNVQGFLSLTYLSISLMSYNFTFCNLTSLKTLNIDNIDVLNASVLNHMLACNAPLHNLQELGILVGSLESPSALLPSLSTLINLHELGLSGYKRDLHEEHPLPLFVLCSLPEIRVVGIEAIWMEASPLSNCSFNHLQQLSLFDNNMSGLLPLLHAPQLSYLRLDENMFSGPIPQQWENCTQLISLDLSHIAMEEIPNWVFTLPLEYLSLASSNLQSIPCPKLSLLNNTLYELSLPSNHLTHDILQCVEIVPFHLTTLDLSSNPLNSVLPSNISFSTKVDIINLSMSGIYGNLPPNFFSLESIDLYLDLSLNSLSGDIPSVIWNISIMQLDFSNNNFTSIATSTTMLPPKSFSLRFLSLSNNIIHTNFVNWFTLTLLGSCDKLLTLDISNNSFHSNIPQAICNCSNLINMFLQENHLEGEIPSQLGQLWHLEMLSLRNNSLSGSIPSTISNCTSMKLLDVSDNVIGGWLDNSPIQHMLVLHVLVLASNQFHGNIPEWIGTFSPQLQFLDMSHNYLSGTIPNNLSLHAFRNPISNNSKLRPSYEGKSEYKMHLVQYFDKGMFLNYTYVLDTLECLDLSNNNLSGEIPSELGHLIGMHSLHLSHNNLVGNIPTSISHLMCLESLDLSWNELNGSIPLGLGNISFLAYLRLGHNHLTGRIPDGTQLRGFANDSYLPNDGLCGPPLNNACSNHTTNNTSYPIKYTNKTTLELLKNSIIFSVFTGYAIGFLGLSIIMFFLRRRYKLEACLLIRE